MKKIIKKTIGWTITLMPLIALLVGVGMIVHFWIPLIVFAGIGFTLACIWIGTALTVD